MPVPKRTIRRRAALVLAGLACLVGAPGIQGAEDPSGSLLVILDASRSMWGQIDGVAKIQIAKDALTEWLGGAPPDVETGLLVYGHRKKRGCDDIEMIVAPGRDNRDDLARAVQGLVPRGSTPIAGSLELAAERLGDAKGTQTWVLVSDGKENCKRDPCALVRSLAEEDRRVRVHAVGFSVDAEATEQLQCIAAAGGGQYWPARSADELVEALAQARKAMTSGAAMADASRGQGTSSQEDATAAARSATPASEGGDAEGAIGQGEVPVAAVEGEPASETVESVDATERAAAAGGDAAEVAGPAAALGQGPQVLAGDRADTASAHSLSPGKGALVLAHSSNYAYAHDAETGEQVAFLSATGEPAEVPPGTYRIRFDEHDLGEVEVAAGQTRVVDVRTGMGWIALTGSKTFAHLCDGRSDERLAFLGADGTPRQIPAGTYRICFENFTIADVEVAAGEKVQVDVAERMGWIQLQGLAQHGYAFERQTGEKMAILSPSGQPAQVPAGRYRIKLGRRTIENLVVAPGQTVVID